MKLNCIVPLRRTTWILIREGVLSENVTDRTPILTIAVHLTFGISTLTLMVISMLEAIKAKDTMVLNQMVCVLISAITVLAKVSAVLRNKQCFVSVIDDLQSDIFNMHDKRQNEHIQFVHRVTSLILRYYVLVGTTFVLFSCFLPFIVNVKMVIPPPFEVGRFEFVYKIVHFAMISYMVLNSVIFDTLYLSLMGLCVAQLTILQEKLIGVFREAESRKKGNQCSGIQFEAEHVLRECVILHDTLNEFVKKLSTILSLPLFIQYTCGCFIICNTILQLTISEDIETVDVISLISYSFATFSQLVLYHWLGNEIMFKSDKIIESCYLAEWYELNKCSRKFILLLMERAKKPLIIELYALIYISLDSLGVIIRWSYSLFAVIKARYN